MSDNDEIIKELRDTQRTFAFIQPTFRHSGDYKAGRDLLNRAADALARSSEQAAQGWQPIETAPKDGTPVDLFSQYGRRWCNYRWDKQIRRGMWSDAAYAHRVWHDRPCMYEASVTHWMPIPSAPVSGSTEAANG
jgi:hypothetical protein